MPHGDMQLVDEETPSFKQPDAPRMARTMDVVREAPPKSPWKKYWYVPAAVAVLILFASVKHYVGSASYIARRDDLRLSVVQKGDFAVNVRANGKMKSKETFMLGSRVSGSVGRVFAKSGDAVDVDTPVVELVNPQLTVDLVQAESKLKQISAERLVELKSLETTLLDEQIQLLTAKNAYQTALREFNAKSELAKFGAGLVSAMDLQQSKASMETQQQIWKLSDSRVAQMHERLEAQRRAHDVELAQLRADVVNVQSQIAQLVVRSTMKGTLQSLAVSPGQKLNIGDSVGVVADTTHLIAQLEVPELQVQQVTVGLPVTIDTRQSKVEGQVIRVAPSVEGGMVEVDVALNGNVPPEARADLSVEGLIRVLQLKNVLYIDRPDFAKAGSTQNLYRLNADESRATRTPVAFGEASVNQIRIVNGVQPGDKIVTSDTSAFASHDTIVVN
jgi:HlyD family secretion protein